MRNLNIIVLLFLCPLFCLAQSNYHGGYVLKNNGDTLKGYINYREWSQSPRSIDFKMNKNDRKAMEFNAATIKRFEISGMETYVSYIGLISMDRTRFTDLTEGLDTTKKLDTIFLQQVATGSHLTLFYQSDAIKTRFFISEANGTPVELKYYEYFDDLKHIISSNIYKGRLLLYINTFAPGNTNLISKAERAKYDQEDLVAVVDGINDNRTVNNKKQLTRLFAGLAINSTNTEVNDANGFRGVQSSITTSPKIDAGIDIFGNPNVQSLIFRVEASFSYVTPRYYYPATVNSVKTNQVYSFNQYNTTITPQIILNVYNKDNFKVYIDGGIAFNLSGYSDDKIILLNADPATVNAYSAQKPYVLATSWSDFPLQAGVVLNKKMEFSFTYTAFSAYTKYTDFSAANQIISLGVKYFLGKH
jgi:hypothetical protein